MRDIQTDVYHAIVAVKLWYNKTFKKKIVLVLEKKEKEEFMFF